MAGESAVAPHGQNGSASGPPAAGPSSIPAAGAPTYDPKQDPEIFRPDGLIVIPRSDGDPAYRPPNVKVPSPSESEVNYFHVWNENDVKYQRWCATCGTDLAEWAGKRGKPPNGKAWRLKAFPKDYYFTEQRKGPKASYRTDPYLFGSNAHRFRSTKEFLHHAQWLIADPTLNPANCTCRYCTGSKNAVPSTEGALRKQLEEKDRPPTKSAARQGRPSLPSSKKLANAPSVRIRTQQLPPPIKRVEIGVVVPSVPARDADLSRSAAAVNGQCEGYRIGEIVWVKLTRNFTDPQNASRVIDKWPAIISDVTFTTTIAPPPRPVDPRRANGTAPTSASAQPGTPGGSTYSLEGRVRQERLHEIVLFGAPADRGKVGEDRLIPFLAGHIHDDVKRSSFGKAEEHTWLDKPGGMPPKLYLLEPKPMSVAPVSFSTMVAALAYSMTVCSYMRSRYFATNAFEVPDGAIVRPPLAPATPSSATRPASPSSSTPSTTATYPPNPYPSATSAAAAPTATTPVTPSATAESEIRPALADRFSERADRPQDSPSRPPAQVMYKPGNFFQGVQAGLERLWVGDVVRLKLREREVREMFESIAAEKQLERKSDANDGFDTRGSYVMRVRAFMEENRKLRAAGRVYQIMTKSQFETKKAEEQKLYDAKAERDAANGDPFGGVGRPFAFPALGVLTSSGKELPSTPSMPEGFYLSPINRESHEVVVDLVNVAGRLWTSLAEKDDAQLAQDFISEKVPYTRALDCEVSEWARASLVGALPGFVKPMNLEARERGSRDDLMKACFEISRTGVRTMIREAISAEGGYVPPDPDPEPTVAANGQSKATNGQQNSAEEQSGKAGQAPPSSSSTPSTTKRKATEDITSSETPSKRPAPAPTSTPSHATPTTTTTTSTPVVVRDMIHSTNKAPEQEKEKGREGSPPLPPGWVKKVSRSGHGVYYANPRTKQTSWDRPTK
ncbi:unnamed protein product [Sympodiomycopsis kandeliae]